MGHLIGSSSGARISVVARQSTKPRLIGAGIPGPAGKDGAGSATQDSVLIAGTSISGHRAVFAEGSSVRYASSDDLAGAERYVGITTQAAEQGAEISVRRTGVIKFESWNWGLGPVYLGLNGSLTQSPTLPGVLLVVGVALSATELDVRLASPIEFL